MDITELLTNPYFVKFAIFTTICRYLNKPIMSAIAKYVKRTPGKEDDERFAKFKSSKLYLGICFILDLSMSIKLPKGKK